MGNSSSKDGHSPRHDARHHNVTGYSAGSAEDGQAQVSAHDQQLANQIYSSSRRRHGSQSNLGLFNIGGGRDREEAAAAADRPRETKPEREARRAERERQARLKERERSMREESVDGGYLVTLGVYTGPEDFNKAIVRQLQIERRLAPFWRGLNDHESSWTEAQLFAAARGLPIPAPDEILPEMERTASQMSTDAQAKGLTVPINSRKPSNHSDASANLSASHPAFSSSMPPSPATHTPPLFRGRSKTLASLAGGLKGSSSDLTPQEIQLPNDPFVNGQRLEAVLYKDAVECPICFMYYPPYLNRTRCCNQDICSECFVQIKRPDPHPPEHEQPGQPRPPEEEAEMLVSEVAACPFCVTPEFGVTYDPPPFRRGLAYAASHSNPLRTPTSAMSSSSSLSNPVAPARRRATSLSASAPNVITTDRVRPDWAKKLADARANALRRSAAATALHNAAYMLGGEASLRSGGLRLGMRRRTLFADSPGASGSATPRDGEASGDMIPGRTSSRRPRVEDIEELMMMEAIRLSLAAEEERKRKEEKAAEKEAKKKAKEAKKEEKKAEKNARKNSGTPYQVGSNASSSTWGSAGMARSTSNLGASPRPPVSDDQIQGKGKQPVQDISTSNTSELTAALSRARSNTGGSGPPPSSAAISEDPQRHLEASRAQLQPSAAVPEPTNLRPVQPQHSRQLSTASSIATSSIAESTTSSLTAPGSYRAAEPSFPFHLNPPSGLDVPHRPSPSSNASSASLTSSAAITPQPASTPSSEPLLNFRSLAAMVDVDERALDGEKPRDAHVEDVGREGISSQPEEKTPAVTTTTAAVAASTPKDESPERHGEAVLKEDVAGGAHADTITTAAATDALAAAEK